jgi:hypothetical protein
MSGLDEVDKKDKKKKKIKKKKKVFHHTSKIINLFVVLSCILLGITIIITQGNPFYVG